MSGTLPPNDEKYIVFRRDEWLSFWSEMVQAGMPSNSVLDNIEDAVVIRRQDVFAPPALESYANSITAAIAIAQDVGGHIPGVDEVSKKVRNLQEIADYFARQAEASWADSARKVPD